MPRWTGRDRVPADGTGGAPSLSVGPTGYHRLAMAEQLTFSLEAALPRPGDVAPMWPTPRPDPFDSPDWLFEPTWGGHRALAFVSPGSSPSFSPGTGSVRVVDPRGVDVGLVLPELTGLAVRVAAGSAVLDGELVVADAHGRADDEALRLRLSGHAGRPVAFLVFDLLHLDGKWLLNVPLDKRRALLRKVLRPGDEVVMVPAITGEGRALHAAVSAQGIAGVLARRRSSPYLPGVRSRLWQSMLAGSPEATSAALAEPGPAADPQGTAPVLALFRRLPFDEEPEG
jgi:bifunctional non-homologous end joining protein LigD